MALGLGALGVVFGDIGTSPLYTIRECLHALPPAEHAVAVLGVLSLVVWSLILVVSVKYTLFVLRADNRGEGGIFALLALGREETMYFFAYQDDEKNRLRSHCSYHVEGVAPKARWWSVTAYADDMFLFDAPNKHYSLNGTNARLDANGHFAFTTGGQEQPGIHWLPTPGARGMVLTLRVYNPEPELQAAPASLLPPSIKAIGVCI